MSGPVHKFNLRLPEPLYERLKREAAQGGLSLNTYIVSWLELGGSREECDHQPYLLQGRGICYRCGSAL